MIESEVIAPSQDYRAAAVGQIARPAAGARSFSRARAAKRAVSLSDPDAVPFTGPRGFAVGYNGQAVVDSKAQIVVAAEVVAAANDSRQLPAMLDEVQAMTGQQPTAIVADTGYFGMPDVAAAEAKGVAVFVPDRRQTRGDSPLKNPYHKEHFAYNPEDDTYTCPEGRRLVFRCMTQWGGQATRAYIGRECQGCAAQASGACTTAYARSLAVFGHEKGLKEHAATMQTEAAKAVLRRRKAIVEPVFASFREHIGLQRFLVRGLAKVQAEWRLVCVAHNLRKLYTLWWRMQVLSEAAIP
jgi:hypothetical protein